jgi:hypothetical protein
MTTPLSIAAMVVRQTAADILAIGLEVATAVGLPATTWRSGDPTRTTFKYLARVLASLEDQNGAFIESAFLRSASGDYLTIVAEDTYGVTPGEATYATPSVTITNTGTRRYALDPGDLVVRSSANGKTYHSVDAGTWNGGTTLAISFIADEAGSDSSCGVNEIDELVTTFLGLTITASTASTAADAQDEDSVKQACEDSRGALSPNGPADAYNYVVKNSELTGSVEITRAETFDGGDLEVNVFVAGNAGIVSGVALAAAQDAVEQWATPIGFRPTVANATALPTALEAVFVGDNLPDDFASKAAEAWSTLVNTYRIGKRLTLSTINQTLRNAVPEANDLILTLPAADVAPASNEVITVSTVAIAEG